MTLLAAPTSALAEVTPPQQDGPTSDAPVVLIAMTGLRWDDVRTLRTPALWELSRRGSVGNVVTHSLQPSACPADGWLAVSAGARAADHTVADGTCRTLREPPTDAVVPGWDDYLAAVAEQPYGARPGLLGEVLAETGTAATAIGPGASIALADGSGVVVGTHVRRPTAPDLLGEAVRAALETSDLVVVDAGTVRLPGHATERRPASGGDTLTPEEVAESEEAILGEETTDNPTEVDVIVEPTRTEQVQTVDARVGAAWEAAEGSGATVLVVSLADAGRPALQLAAATGPALDDATYGTSLLTSGSTQQRGLVQTTDLTVTLVRTLGLDGAQAGFVGAPVVPVDGPGTATERLQTMRDMAAEAYHITRVSGAYLTYLVLAQAVLFIAAAVLLTRRGRPTRPGPRGALRGLQVAAVVFGSAPIASFLTGLVPWWRAASPTAGFWFALLGMMALLSALALLGPWRRFVLGPAGVVAGVTVLVLVVDAITGSHLVVDSPMGAHRLVGARFYGMSNPAFAILTAAGLLLAAAVAQPLLARGRRTAATVAVVVIGLVITVVDGAPGLGSDFGGPPAIIVGFAVLAIVVSGRTVRWRTLLLVVVLAGLAAVGFAALDWLRPPADRTHLGRFFATVLDGGLVDVLSRKLEVHLRVLTKWRYLVLAIGGVLLTALVLLGSRPGARNGSGTPNAVAGLGRAVPLVSSAMAAVGLALGVGFLINDSGIVVPATGIAVAVPCLVAAAAQWRLTTGDGDTPEGSALVGARSD